ncbi:hypothetical protein ABEF92_006049 [Exophiala dermatitidis]|uniref:Phosphatidylserine decarboxylase n=1 Tax=Exophiala dermatitidis (strain ATCC 34100 / CBS 525.76 / NIH/UT8656) TaxID=858893 RepID=H6C0M9_EXODN|nr:phosphatidylserine decarboxylase [Exophiala dermatitidis NIH/UT8656]EHY57271.1 phosphatidylserine decarboxylase [Exophiala dermatitidis NIH/UT8656]
MFIPGVLSNLVERQAASSPQYKNESNTGNLMAIHGTFCGLAVVTVLLRLYVRIFMLKSLGADDYVMVAATVLAVATLVCFIGEAVAGGLGKHPSLVSAHDWSLFLHWRYFHSLIVMFAISLVKVSIACFLRRFVPNRNYQRFLLGSIIFLCAFMLSCAGTLIFNCGTDISANWDFELKASPNVHCFSNRTFTNVGIFNSSINIATDVLFALLPVPIVWKLQTNIRTKITLVGILGLGLFACAASIVKTVYQATALKEPDWTYHDSFFMWNFLELTIGIVAASLPSLRPLFVRLLGATQRLTSSGGRNRRNYANYDADGLGYRVTKSNARGGTGNPARQYYAFGSRHSTELGDLGRGASENAFPPEDPNKVAGVTSTVTAGDDSSDKVMLEPDFHSAAIDKEWARPAGAGITKTTTVQIARY